MSAGNFTNKPGIKGEYNYIRGLACPSWSGSIHAGGYKVCVSSLSKCDILVCPVSPYSPSLIARSFTSPPGRAREHKFLSSFNFYFYFILFIFESERVRMKLSSTLQSSGLLAIVQCTTLIL